MAPNDELLAKARFHAGQIIDGVVEPLTGAQLIWQECSLQCNPRETSLDPFVYWASEFEDAIDSDRQIFCSRAMVEAAHSFLNSMRSVSPEYRDPDSGVWDAIQSAEQLMALKPAPDGENDPRWQAIIAIGEFLPSSPEPIWQFIRRWGLGNDDDLQSAIATCLLEHLLDQHFDAYFDRVETMARAHRPFAAIFLRCGKGGQSLDQLNEPRFDALTRELRGAE
jgi:hypothetical protein